ncbi:MAG: FAD:protein FMN transferase [Chitinophagaceae bacterium]
MLAIVSATAQVQRYQFTQPKMGSPFHLIFYTTDSVTAQQKATAAFALIDSLNRIFSDYDSTSELSRLSATSGRDSFVKVSSYLYDMIIKSKRAAVESRGSFDITMGPLSRLWRRARREKTFPLKAEVAAARALTGMDKIVIDEKQQKVKLLQRGMQLDLGGIGKGYIAQEVVNYFKREGITQVLADAGGDIVCGDAPPGKAGWTIAVNVPGEKARLLNKNMLLQNSAVATSGDVYQYIEHEGKRYAHIIDPRAGYGVTFQRNVTVVAADGALADWLATASSILPLCRAKKLVKKKNAALLITQIKRGKLKSTFTQTIEQYWSAQ